MLVTINGRMYQYGFRQEHHWEANLSVTKPAHVSPTPCRRSTDRSITPHEYTVVRHIRGRTQCSISTFELNDACPFHGSGRSSEGRAVKTCLCKRDKQVEVEALCSQFDRFEPHIGRKIALHRALRAMGLEYDERKAFWEQYLEHIRIPRVVPEHVERRPVRV